MMGFGRELFGMGIMHFGMGGLLGVAAFFAVIALLIVLIVRTARHGREEGRFTRAEDILKERLAKGEISAEEYDELLKKIR
jgi:putative membrane protein